MFKLSSLNLRRQREFLANADDTTRRAKVSMYLKKLNAIDLSSQPLNQYDEPRDPARWGPNGLQRSDHIQLRFIPALPSSGRSSCDSTPCHIPPSVSPTPSKRTVLSTSSFPSAKRKGKGKQVYQKEEKEDMIEMTIHNQHHNKIVILFDAIFWKTSPFRNYHQVPTADISLAIELFQEHDVTKSSHWWLLAQAASKETSMRYNFTETGVRIDYVRKNVRFSSEKSPVHIYEPIWPGDEDDEEEEDDLGWERGDEDEAVYYEDADDTDDSDTSNFATSLVDEVTVTPPPPRKMKLTLFTSTGSPKTKMILTSPSESSLSSGTLETPA